MKNLMLSAAIAALALPVTACAGESTKSQEAGTQESAAASREPASIDPTGSASSAEMPAATASTESSATVSYPGATDISAKAFLGEEIYGDAGESIAHVADILIGADGSAERIVYRTGGIGGVGGKKSAIDFDMVSIGLDDPASSTSENDPLLRLSMTAEQMKKGVDFNQVGDDDYRLASEILGANIDLVSLPEQDSNAVVDDLIMADDGHVKEVIVQRSMVGSVGAGDRYAFDFSLLRIEEGDGAGIALDVTEAQFNSANKFEYKRSDAIKEAIETAKEPDGKY